MNAANIECNTVTKLSAKLKRQIDLARELENETGSLIRSLNAKRPLDVVRAVEGDDARGYGDSRVPEHMPEDEQFSAALGMLQKTQNANLRAMLRVAAILQRKQ